MEPLLPRTMAWGLLSAPPAGSSPELPSPLVVSLQSWASGMQADCTCGNQATPDKPRMGVYYSCPRLLAWAESLRCGSERTQGGPVPCPLHLPPPSLACAASPRAEACPTPVGNERGELGWASPNVPGHIVPSASAGLTLSFCWGREGDFTPHSLEGPEHPHPCFCSGYPGSWAHRC